MTYCSQVQGVPRRVLKVILSIESGAKSQTHQATRKNGSLPIAPAPSKSVLPSPKPHPQPSPEMKVAVSSRSAQALSIIATESGIDVDDLTDGLVFNDAGVDSLMGLTISARFKEEMDLDIDFNALFYEYPTVKSLKEMLGDTVPVEEDAIDTLSDSTPRSTTPSYPATNGTGTTTPDPRNGIDFKRALGIVSEESGVAIEDFTDETSFADSGVDSLLSLVIVSRFRDELEIDIPHESLFLECDTVADLRRLIDGDTTANKDISTPPLAECETELTVTHMPTSAPASKSMEAPTRSEAEISSLTTRRKAVEQLVQKYTTYFFGPSNSPSNLSTTDHEKVVMVTGASGGLGAHVTYHIAQLSDVKTVVCLNRENKSEGYVRQQKAMRDKGIRFPETLRHKLQVFQTDTSKPRFGLSHGDYEVLVNSVTHLIHNAWPMSAKRPLSGFESQFQVMRNLIDFACEVASRRSRSFKFGFQMVSSIGVVGQYGFGSNQTKKIIVPEERVGIDSVLPNGYGEAKWGCEWMLDLTLHQHPDRFRTMVVRLGQIAGSKTSGYWNPTEHFPFLIKSSQTLNALPNMLGDLYWTPVNNIAAALSDLVLADNHTPHHPVYHIENPVGQPWREMTSVLAEALHIPPRNVIPFPEWIERVRKAPPKDNPAAMLVEFLEDNFLRISCGGLVLDTKKALEHSRSLREVGPVSAIVARKYVHIWREIGFLSATEEDRARFGEERVKLWGKRD